MSEIQVITSDLYNGSNTLNSTATELGKVQAQLGEIIDATGDAYDGQLRQALEDIIGSGVQSGGKLQNRAGELGRELSDRAMGFEEANVAGQNSTLKTSTAYINFVGSTPKLGFLSIIKNKLKSFTISVLSMVGLAGLAERLFVINSSSSSIANNPTIEPSKTYKGMAYKVSEDNKELNEKLGIYGRGPGSYSSNCTWYTAAAVYEAHGILLISYERDDTKQWFKFGNGGEWADNAQIALNDPTNKYHSVIKAVDKMPAPGSVYSGPSGATQGHVYFVENAYQVTKEDGSQVWHVEISEENYMGKALSGDAQKVEISNHPEVRRWTRTINYPVNNNGEAITLGKFIHFNR